jgi:hypothetical protein
MYWKPKMEIELRLTYPPSYRLTQAVLLKL